MSHKKIALLRGVMPSGPNAIPKMAYVREILTEAGLLNVKTYIQSGNVIFETDLSAEEVRRLIHDTIQTKIGSNLSVILKEPDQLKAAAAANPFDDCHDKSRVHLVFTNDELPREALQLLTDQSFGDEKFVLGHECLYLYLPREAKKKKLNTNYLEKQLRITATMRKLSVVTRLSEM